MNLRPNVTKEGVIMQGFLKQFYYKNIALSSENGVTIMKFDGGN